MIKVLFPVWYSNQIDMWCTIISDVLLLLLQFGGALYIMSLEGLSPMVWDELDDQDDKQGTNLTIHLSNKVKNVAHNVMGLHVIAFSTCN